MEKPRLYYTAWSLVGCRLWGRTESDTTEVMQQQQQQAAVMSNGAVTLEKQSGRSSNTELLYDPAVLIPGIYPRELRTHVLT